MIHLLAHKSRCLGRSGLASLREAKPDCGPDISTLGGLIITETAQAAGHSTFVAAEDARFARILGRDTLRGECRPFGPLMGSGT